MIFRLLLRICFAGLPLVLATIFLCDHQVREASAGKHTNSVDKLNARPVAIVLGCSSQLNDGRPNLYFLNRIEAAASLYRAGKCRWIIVSGDNGHTDYDEPGQMKEALIAKGIPEESVICDFAGFRTLDSIARAKAVFQVKEAIIVSQPFHNERALFLAQHLGLDAVGFDAASVSFAGGLRTRLREKLARVKTVLDVHLLKTKPRFYGPAMPFDGGGACHNITSPTHHIL